MKLLSALALLFVVQISTASISASHPINPDPTGMNFGNFSPKNPLQPFGVSSISSNGRFVAYLTEHVNLENSNTIDLIAHRYDRTLNVTLSSDRIVKNIEAGSSQVINMIFEDPTAQSILFTHLVPESTASSNFSGFSISQYHFDNQTTSNYKDDVGLGWSMSPNGKFFIYSTLSSLHVLDTESKAEMLMPTSHTLTNGNVINFFKPSMLFTHQNINDKGDIVLVVDSDSKAVEGASRYYQYNIKTEEFVSFNNFIPSEYDMNFYGISDEFNTALELEINIPLISNSGQYISLVAKNSLGNFVILLFDTISSNIVEHELPFEIGGGGVFMPRLLTNSGVAQFFTFWEDASELSDGVIVYYLYDFNSNQVLEHASISLPARDSTITEMQWNMVDQISLDGDIVVAYDAKNISGQEGIESSLHWMSLSANNERNTRITLTDTVIDPYSNPISQFSIDVSGTDIYGLDVSCNLSSESLSITQANYNGLFSSQNTMTLPLVYSASSITATETLVAPELPFTGAGSFVLADVIADFTTEDVQVICAAEVSDENGQLLQVTLTPATISIDDGVHGGAGAVSGTISIPGVTDLSGVEVVLTIDGRQVTVITDETGTFSFDGLRDGDFTISLASENYVQSCQVANVAEGGAVDLGSIELLPGDINADGNIDIADFTFMAARYRSNQGDADYDAKSDLNKDGTINIQDLAILGSHFGSTQCNL